MLMKKSGCFPFTCSLDSEILLDIFSIHHASMQEGYLETMLISCCGFINSLFFILSSYTNIVPSHSSSCYMFVFMQGPPGTGKTVTSASVVYHLAKQNNG